MVNRANGTRENGHRANGNRANVVAPISGVHEKGTHAPPPPSSNYLCFNVFNVYTTLQYPVPRYTKPSRSTPVSGARFSSRYINKYPELGSALGTYTSIQS